MSKRKRTAWRIEDLALWLSRYDEIRKAGTDRAPYNYETWILIIKDVALDYADYLEEWHREHVKEHSKDIDKWDKEEANGV